MKLLVISHPCATPINQQFFAQLEQQTGWDLTIVVPANWIDEYGSRKKPERWAGYRGRLLAIPVWKPGNIPLHTYRTVFIPLLRELEVDAIYVHHEPYAVATAQVFLANRWSVRRPIGFFSCQNILKRYPPPFRQTERLVFRDSCFAFPVTLDIEKVLRTKGYTGPSTILPFGLDPEVYFPRPQVADLRKSLGTGADQVLIGYIGRVTEEKGLKTLLRALKEIDELPWHLLVIGSGPFETRFDLMVQDLAFVERVKRLGYVPHTEVPHFLSAFDLLVLPSETRPHWREQFGRVIIEAMACGTSVVGSDSGEIPHLIRATGGGLIFSEAQPQALADCLRQMIQEPMLRARLAEQGRAVVLRDFMQPVLAQRFAEAINLEL